jgi:tRNA A37 methylthiotransferase MiaB
MVNIIVGFPGETEDDFEETVESIRRKRYYITQISAVSMCLVNNDTELDTNTQKYGIILPEDARIRAKEWYTFDKINTYESRKKRVEKILRLINQLELSYVTITT